MTMPSELELTLNPQADKQDIDDSKRVGSGSFVRFQSRQLSRSPIGLCGFKSWMLNLEGHFGFKLLVALFTAQHLVKGFAQTFVSTATRYLFKAYHVPGTRIQIFSGVFSIPWVMKPIIGLLSDHFPICGYNKAPYIVATTVSGVLACLTVGLVEQSSISIEAIVTCLFVIQLQISTIDLLTEAKYAEKMQRKPECGPDLMTYVWMGLTLASLVAVALVGPVVGCTNHRFPFVVAAVPLSSILLPVRRNYLEETCRARREFADTRRQLARHKEACVLCVLIFAASIILSCLGIIFKSSAVNGVAGIIVAVVILAAFSVVLRPVIAKVNAFFLVQTALGFSTAGTAQYFFTDGEKEYPVGPHFSMEFFTSGLGVISLIFQLIGIASYNRYMKHWTYRRILVFTNVASSVLSISDVVLFARLNTESQLGAWAIPDRTFVIGSTVMETVVQQWMWMPGVVILSQLCPEDMEATMYALLAGCHNLGGVISSSSGAMVLEWLGCAPNGQEGVNESAQFKNLWIGALLSIILPLGTLPLVPWLIPDARQTDKLLEDNDKDATSGSLWRKLTGH